MILLTAFILINLFSASITKEAIVSATKQELEKMAELRSIDINGLTDDEIKERILDYEGLEKEEVKGKSEN